MLELKVPINLLLRQSAISTQGIHHCESLFSGIAVTCNLGSVGKNKNPFFEKSGKPSSE